MITSYVGANPVLRVVAGTPTDEPQMNHRCGFVSIRPCTESHGDNVTCVSPLTGTPGLFLQLSSCDTIS